MPDNGIPIDQWDSSENNRSWSTQFNDLHEVVNPTQTFFFELKKQALFDKQTIIRDADLVNSVDLLSLLNDPRLGIKFAIEKRMFVFARRIGSTSFTQVNNMAGEVRAFPKRFRLVQDELAKFDQLISDYPVILVPNDPNDDTFKAHLDRVEQFGLLEPFQTNLLQKAKEQALSLSQGTQLKFGHIYRHLEGAEQTTSDKQEQTYILQLKQFCRTAHVLTVPAKHGIRPSTTNFDLDPFHVSVVLGHTHADTSSEEDLARWYDLWPKILLEAHSLLSMSFEDIDRLRKSNSGSEYFRSMQAAQEAYGTPEFNTVYTRYLYALEQYLLTIQKDAKAQVLHWRKWLAETAIAHSQKWRDLASNVIDAQVPLIATLSALDAYDFLTHSILPTSDKLITAGGAVAAAIISTGLKTALKHHYIERPTPLSRLMNGTTYTPPKFPNDLSKVQVEKQPH